MLQPADPSLLRHLPAHRRDFHEETPEGQEISRHLMSVSQKDVYCFYSVSKKSQQNFWHYVI